MQKDSTLQFWNDYHDATSDSKEWIVKPSDELLQRVVSAATRLPCMGESSWHTLEIGCGTSTFARQLFEHVNLMYPSRNVSMIATDVSSVCIQHNQLRDAHSLKGKAFQYQVYDVTESLPAPWLRRFDLILDKGCLDTFLFRTRLRSKRAAAFTEKILSNIHAMLRDSKSLYMVLSPRRKIKALRDSKIFRYERHILQARDFDTAALVDVDDCPCTYMHLCWKKEC